MKPQLIRAAILHCLDDPGEQGDENHWQYLPDALLYIEEGLVQALLPDASQWESFDANAERMDLRGQLLIPGLIDAHVHYPQLEMIAAYGDQLLDWLNRYTYPTELRYADERYAEAAAEFFMREMLRRGTTTAAVFPTVHPASVDAIFKQAYSHNMRLISGKVWMDRHAPEALCDTPQTAVAQSRSLIKRWHGRGRLSYAVTPRFAVTSTAEQLQSAGDLAREIPDLYIHSHLAESKAEVKWIRELFPDARSYLDVYDHFGLLREKSLYAHCIHLDKRDRARMAESGAAAIFCPSSNLFLGSGLFDLRASAAAGIGIALGTDVGAGTDLGVLPTMRDAYNILQLQGQKLPAMRALYFATLGSARALSLDAEIGNFMPGKAADFVALNLAATPLLAKRTANASSIVDQLFAAIMLGDDRLVESTWVFGKRCHLRED